MDNNTYKLKTQIIEKIGELTHLFLKAEDNTTNQKATALQIDKLWEEYKTLN